MAYDGFFDHAYGIVSGLIYSYWKMPFALLGVHGITDYVLVEIMLVEIQILTSL